MSSIHKVIYKPDSQSTDEYTVIISDTQAYQKWKDGDTTIALAGFLDSFDIFHSTQGAQGILGRASKQQLDTVFGTTKDVEVIEKILRSGKNQNASGISSGGTATNLSRGSGNVDTGRSGI